MGANSTVGANRVALRLARREAHRHPWRSLLVMVLVAVPVAGMVIATTLTRTDSRTPMQEWDDRYGPADLFAFSDPDFLRQQLPDGVGLPGAIDRDDITRIASTYGGFRTAESTARVAIVSLDLDHRLWAHRYDVTGRAPTTRSEIALSTTLADRFHVRPGDALTLVRPELDLIVTAVVEDRECLRCDAVFGPEGGPTFLVDAFGGGENPQYVIDLGAPSPDDLRPFLLTGTADVRPLPSLHEFSSSADGNASGKVAWTVVIGALVLAVVGIVIAAAFAAGARGQLASLGLLSASGAPQAMLRRVLVLQGTVTGIAGSILGFGVAGLTLGLGHGVAETFLNRRVAGYDVGGTELVAIAVVGVIGATVAALVPSKTVASIPTLAALSGRRPVEPVSVSFTVRGVVSMAAGFLLLVVAASGANGGSGTTLFAIVAITGGCMLLFGAAALTPAMVQRIEPLARRSRGAMRLAGRGLARNRSRSGAIVAAVAAAGALAVGGTALARGIDRFDATYLSLHPDVVALTGYDIDGAAAGIVPDATVDAVVGTLSDPTTHRTEVIARPVRTAGRGYGFDGAQALVVDDELGRDLRLSSAARRSLQRDGVVVLSYSSTNQRRIVVEFDGVAGREADLVFSPHGVRAADGILVTPSFADELRSVGGRGEPGPVFVTDDDGIDDVEHFDLDDLRTSGSGMHGVASTTAGRPEGGDDPSTYVEIEYGFDPQRFDSSLLELGLAALSVVFALLVVGIGLTLAAADDRTERQQLSVAGAGPSTMARVSGLQAAILALGGFLLAVPVGFLPVVAVSSVLDGGARLTFPADTVAVLLVLVPALAYVGARTVSALAQRVRPLRISRAVFD